ncbi:hypothetical protein C6499_21980 [Candidatus Poribacteria bacterium]|nr:MAG: hypothetical protein C6499_21980 [Candidatus Poribacteria bacterium]
MRAGVLSDDRVIEFLNENFINVWVSNVELERTPRKQAYMARRRKELSKTFDRTHPLAKAIMKGWKEHSPVDCLVIAPEYDVMGKLPLNDFFDDCSRTGVSEEEAYLKFLEDSLAGKFPGFADETSDALSSGLNVVLNPEQTEQEVLDILRTPRYGYQDYTVVEIDATAFEEGGTLTINIRMGTAKPGGSFDLFDNNTELPTKGIPNEALTSVWDIPSGQIGKIRHRFDEGKVFKLGATGTWFNEKGSINAFHARIAVEPTENP